jgi:4-hydroxybenzoate polyprenyltransferase
MKNYINLMRLNKPIGIFLLLWPTLWALWLASEGAPSVKIVCIFVMGVVLMRSAGCVINDIADRNVDKYVARTQNRPLTSGRVSLRAALILFFSLIALAFGLVLFLNPLTIMLAIVGAALAVLYPFLKRVTHLPQMGLGMAFAWGVPMAFAAEMQHVPLMSWIIFLAAAAWTVMFDTMYAMVDREDDIKVGIKSTAILWGQHDYIAIAILQFICVICFIAVGYLFQLNAIYFLSAMVAILLFGYQQWLIQDRLPEKCFQAFLNNNWVGLVIFVGILFS